MTEILTLTGVILILLMLLPLFIASVGFFCIQKERLSEQMEMVYATLIIMGKKRFSEVPERIKEKVRQVLVDLDLEELTEE